MLISRMAAVALFGSLPLVVTAQTPSALNGTWVIDVKQTEDYLKRVGPPSRNAEWLAATILRMCTTTMTFEGDKVTIDPFSSAPMEWSFRLVPHSDKELTYTTQTSDGGKDTWTISFLNENSITVKSLNMKLMEYGIWKRGNRPNRQTAQSDLKQAFESCASALENVPFIRSRTR